MNQILSTGDNSKKKKEKKTKNKKYQPNNYSGQTSDIVSVARVFAISLIIFAVFVIGSASYGLYKSEENKSNVGTGTVQVKPTISVENVEGTQNTVLLKVTSNTGLEKVIYQWNDGQQVTLNGNGGKYIEQKIQVPNGTNNLSISAIDVLGNENIYTKQYKLNSKINLEATSEGKIKITYDGDVEVSYMTYRWDEEEETKVDINDTTIDYEIDTLSGRHTLTIVVVDINNATETKVQETNGISIPKIDISLNDDETAYIIKVTDEIELKEVIITLDEDESKKYGQKLSGKEFQFEIALKEGDNKMKVEVTNSDDQKAEKMVKFSKYQKVGKNVKYQIFELLTYFVIYSFAGWVMESIFRSISERKLINTGFLKGPFCPIYGIGAIIIYVFLSGFKENILLLFLAGFIVLSVWEYIVGILLEKIFHTKYWDYSDNKFNIQGRICLTNSIYWGILGVVFIYYIHPFVVDKLQLIDIIYLRVVVYCALILITVDAITTIVNMKNLRATLEKIEKLNAQIKEKLEEVKDLGKDKAKNEVTENIQEIIHQLDIKKNRIIRKLYKHVYRLKKAFPAIESKEITEILNKKIEIIKDKKDKKVKEFKKEIENKQRGE